jgi:hypothetical protein
MVFNCYIILNHLNFNLYLLFLFDFNLLFINIYWNYFNIYWILNISISIYLRHSLMIIFFLHRGAILLNVYYLLLAYLLARFIFVLYLLARFISPKNKSRHRRLRPRTFQVQPQRHVFSPVCIAKKRFNVRYEKHFSKK